MSIVSQHPLKLPVLPPLDVRMDDTDAPVSVLQALLGPLPLVPTLAL